MGAIAEAMIAFAQPLIDQTDGSIEDLNKALGVSQFCYNLALLPEDGREEVLREMQLELAMGDEQFEAFRSSIIDPMIRRHEEMFPQMHGRSSPSPPSTSALQSGPWAQLQQRIAMPAERRPMIDRYAPCPCNSGKKYKFCCGKKFR